MLQLLTFYPIQVPMQLKSKYGSIYFFVQNCHYSRRLLFSRDSTQDSLDLDRIDVTRSTNRLTEDLISRTQLNANTPTIYDAAQNLPICFDVPSGIYIEFAYVRVPISRTLSYERIVSVRYK